MRIKIKNGINGALVTRHSVGKFQVRQTLLKIISIQIYQVGSFQLFTTKQTAILKTFMVRLLFAESFKI